MEEKKRSKPVVKPDTRKVLQGDYDALLRDVIAKEEDIKALRKRLQKLSAENAVQAVTIRKYERVYDKLLYAYQHTWGFRLRRFFGLHARTFPLFKAQTRLAIPCEQCSYKGDCVKVNDGEREVCAL